MIRFKLGPIPVGVRYGHLFMLVALALYYLQGWQGRGSRPLSVAFVGLTMAVIFVSLLVHELGHALASLAFGYRPAIELIWLGGLTHPNASGPIPWHRDILLTLAGPALGLILSLVCSSTLGHLRLASRLTLDIARLAVWVNYAWSLINLVPVLPLDGGRVSSALLTRLFGGRGFLAAQLLALAVCGMIVLLLLRSQVSNPYPVLLFALLGVRSMSQVTSYVRGHSPPDEEHPAEAALSQAEAAYASQQFDVARQRANAVLQEVTLPPNLRSRAHHLLGWIYLKEGQGRAALDQFSQVSSRPVESKALAAGFALVGDEDRALPLWEMAYRENRDFTILHEWAGTLIRAGKGEEAKKLPGVDLPTAFMCAQRVFSIRGLHGEAAKVGLQGLATCSRPQIAYDTACALSRAGDLEGALSALDKAAALGFRDVVVAESDSDLAPLYGRPEFHAWLRQLRQSNEP